MTLGGAWRRWGGGGPFGWRLAVLVALTAATLPARAQQAASPPPALAPLRFLLGAWEALPGADSSAGSGRATFAPAIQGQVIVRTSYAQYPAGGGRTASRHDDVMVIYAEGDTVRADYYDNEGHVIRYVVRVPAPGTAVFVSAPVGNGPRYRLTYAQTGASTVDGRFEIAPPSAPETFRTYLSWSTRKVGDPAGPGSLPP
jgi:hypothetical protein